MIGEYLQESGDQLNPSVMMADGAAVGPQSAESAITRNSPLINAGEPATDIYDRAREIYFRAGKSHRTRAVSIL